MNKKRKPKGAAIMAKQPTLSPSDLEFLDCFDDGWLQSYVGRLLRDENDFSNLTGFDVEKMPDWAAKVSKNFFTMMGIALTRPKAMSYQAFGKLLGQKVALADAIEIFCRTHEVTNDATRAKLTKFLGGPKGVALLKSERIFTKRIDQIKTDALRRITRCQIDEQGQFYRGFGEGLLFMGQLNRWKQSGSERKHNHSYMLSFAFLFWEMIEHLSKGGGWTAIREFFTTSLPSSASTKISEDAFVKMLQRAGLKCTARGGRPKKNQGQ